jgi:pyridoxal 5'-phosphate synthase pdxS subunit
MSEVLGERHHIAKRNFKVPFVCGARNLGEAFAHRRGRGHDPHQGRGRPGNIVEAVRHMRTSKKKQLTVLGKEELVAESEAASSPWN